MVFGEITLQDHRGVPSGGWEDWEVPLPAGISRCHLTMQLSLAPSGGSWELPFPLQDF